MTRLRRMLDVLAAYPDIPGRSGIAGRRIVDACCNKIPSGGCANDADPADVLEAACEATVQSATDGTLRGQGSAIANFLVATFAGMCVEGIKVDPGRISRFGLIREGEEIARLEAEWAVKRAEDAARPLPDPSLPKSFLAAFPPPPDPDAWPVGKGPVRARLKPRRPVAPETSEPTRVGKLVDGDTAREARELADAEAQWRGT